MVICLPSTKVSYGSHMRTCFINSIYLVTTSYAPGQNTTRAEYELLATSCCTHTLINTYSSTFDLDQSGRKCLQSVVIAARKVAKHTLKRLSALVVHGSLAMPLLRRIELSVLKAILCRSRKRGRNLKSMC